MCSIPVKCGMDGCRATHNKLLHNSSGNGVGKVIGGNNPINTIHSSTPDGNVSNSTLQVGTVDNSTSSNSLPADTPQPTTMHTAIQDAKLSALGTMPVVLKHGNREVIGNALSEDSTMHTYISEGVASELGVHSQAKAISVTVFNNKTESFSSKSVQFGSQSLDGNADNKCVAQTVPNVAGNMQIINWKKRKKVAMSHPI